MQRQRFIELTWQEFDTAVTFLADHVRRAMHPHRGYPGVYGEPRGGLPLAVALSHRLKMPLLEERCPGMIWIDDIVDTGQVIAGALMDEPSMCVTWVGNRSVLAKLDERVLCIAATWAQPSWYVFPWEDRHAAAADRSDYVKSRATR